MTAVKVRVSATVLGFLEGTGAGQAVFLTGSETAKANEHPDDVSLMEALKAAPRRADGSRTVTIDAGEAEGLYRYVDVMVEGARDNISPLEPEALGEYNAGKALLRRLAKAGVTA